jgi:hypothetical protein
MRSFVIAHYSDQIEEDYMSGTYSSHMNIAYIILVGKREVTKPLWICIRKLEENIRIDFKEVWCEGEDLIHVAQNRNQGRALVSTVAENFLTNRAKEKPLHGVS